MKINLGDLRSAADVAKTLGVSSVWVRRLARRGDLRGRVVAHGWIIEGQSVDEYRSRAARAIS